MCFRRIHGNKKICLNRFELWSGDELKLTFVERWRCRRIRRERRTWLRGVLQRWLMGSSGNSSCQVSIIVSSILGVHFFSSNIFHFLMSVCFPLTVPPILQQFPIFLDCHWIGLDSLFHKNTIISPKNEPFSPEMHSKIPLSSQGLKSSNSKPGSWVSPLHFFVE